VDYTIARVARAFHADFWTVAEWPWVNVLIAEQALDDVERVEALREERDRIDLANLVRIGMWSDDGLGKVERAWERQLTPVAQKGPRPESSEWLKAFRNAEARGTWRKA
jgi:hypothetical protein